MIPKKEKLSILQVVEATGAGVGRHVQQLSENLTEQGHRVVVAYSTKRLDAQFRRFVEQKKVSSLVLEMERSVGFHDLEALIGLLKIVDTYGPFDMLHGHSSKAGALTRIIGKIKSIPTVYTPNGLIMASPDISSFKRSLYGLVERGLASLNPSKIIAVCNDEKQLMLELKLKDDAHIEVIENALADIDYLRIQTEAVSTKAPNKLIFGAMMRFSPQKDPENLIRAFHTFITNHSVPFEVELVVAGDGPLFSDIQSLVATLKLEEKVKLLGWQTETYRILSSLDVLILSSKYEGFSYMILEAMASGLPIVSTDVFGSFDTVGSVSGNVIVPHSNYQELAKGMQHITTGVRDLWALKQKLSNIGSENKRYVKEHFYQPRATERTLELYYSLLH
jgi:glycosyltransferase involved in cell wall biosynthesis